MTTTAEALASYRYAVTACGSTVLIADSMDDATVWEHAQRAACSHVVVLPDALPWLTDGRVVWSVHLIEATPGRWAVWADHADGCAVAIRDLGALTHLNVATALQHLARAV